MNDLGGIRVLVKESGFPAPVVLEAVGGVNQASHDASVRASVVDGPGLEPPCTRVAAWFIRAPHHLQMITAHPVGVLSERYLGGILNLNRICSRGPDTDTGPCWNLAVPLHTTIMSTARGLVKPLMIMSKTRLPNQPMADRESDNHTRDRLPFTCIRSIGSLRYGFEPFLLSGIALQEVSLTDCVLCAAR
jgi:hypothetical protein